MLNYSLVWNSFQLTLNTVHMSFINDAWSLCLTLVNIFLWKPTSAKEQQTGMIKDQIWCPGNKSLVALHQISVYIFFKVQGYLDLFVLSFSIKLKLPWKYHQAVVSLEKSGAVSLRGSLPMVCKGVLTFGAIPERGSKNELKGWNGKETGKGWMHQAQEGVDLVMMEHSKSKVSFCSWSTCMENLHQQSHWCRSQLPHSNCGLPLCKERSVPYPEETPPKPKITCRMQQSFTMFHFIST